MIAFAEHEFKLSKVQKDGRTTREHYEAVVRQLGRAPPELVGPRCPEIAEHVWRWFLEIHATRTWSSAAGIANSISWTEIHAWAVLTGNRPSQFEVDCLRALDQAWFRVQSGK